MEFGQEMKANLILPSGYLTSYLYIEIYKELQNIYEKSHIIPTPPHIRTRTVYSLTKGFAFFHFAKLLCKVRSGKLQI